MRRSKSIASEEVRDKQSLVAHKQEVIKYYREGNSLEKQVRNERELILSISFDVVNGMYRMLCSLLIISFHFPL